jgi:hypothetical protein
MEKEKFVKGVEHLINPIDVGSLHFIQSFNKLLPRVIQDQFVKASGKSTPFMGFVVEPYATFFCYEILNIEEAQKLLPDGFRLIKTRIYENDDPKYLCIFGCFNAHTSAFWGARVEFYIIAEDIKTGLLSWIIVDYDSNTISYDKRDGLRDPNVKNGVVTTDWEGKVLIDMPREDKSRELVADCDLKNGKFVSLDQRLWLEGNLSIGYSSEFDKKDASIFSLKFNPEEVNRGMEIPLNDVLVKKNSWYPGLFNSSLHRVIVFPYAQHFISDSPGSSSNLKNREELEKSISNIDFNNIRVFSSKSFKVMFLIGSIVSLLVTISLLVLFILKM